MAENDKTQQGAATSNAADNSQQQGPQFALQRLYLKDASFESPKSPESFQQKWTPKVSFNLNTRNTKLQDDVYEVVLTVTVEAKSEDVVSFLAEVHQGAVFTCKGFKPEDLDHVLGAVCPNIMFPYVRETIDSLVTRGSFPPIMLAPVNFDALYAQSKQERQNQQAGAQSNGEAKVDQEQIRKAMAQGANAAGKKKD